PSRSTRVQSGICGSSRAISSGVASGVPLRHATHFISVSGCIRKPPPEGGTTNHPPKAELRTTRRRRKLRTTRRRRNYDPPAEGGTTNHPPKAELRTTRRRRTITDGCHLQRGRLAP